MKRRVGVVAVIFAALLMVAGCGSSSGKTSPGGSPTTVQDPLGLNNGFQQAKNALP
jgi:ABC-type Fe3+-citrate transport system substrate-binding protein